MPNIARASSKTFNFSPLEIVLARYKGTWHRAAFMTLDPLQEKAAVYFIDILIDAVISVEDIRKIPRVLAASPIFTGNFNVDCSENDLQDATFKDKTNPGSVVVNVKISSDDNSPIIKFN